MRTHAYTRDKKHTSFFSKVTFLLHPNTGLNVYKKKKYPISQRYFSSPSQQTVSPSLSSVILHTHEFPSTNMLRGYD